jgi:hypothetical protein
LAKARVSGVVWCAAAEPRIGPYETAMQGMWVSCNEGEEGGPGIGTERAAESVAPMVPDESVKAVDELRPSASGQQRVYGSSQNGP